MQELGQALSIAIFVAMLVFIIVGKVDRYIPALIGGALVLAVFVFVLQSPSAALDVLNLRQLADLKFWIPGGERKCLAGLILALSEAQGERG